MGTEEIGGYLSAPEVARLLGFTARLIERWADQGRIRTVVTPDGERRFRRADVEALWVRASDSEDAG